MSILGCWRLSLLPSMAGHNRKVMCNNGEGSSVDCDDFTPLEVHSVAGFVQLDSGIHKLYMQHLTRLLRFNVECVVFKKLSLNYKVPIFPGTVCTHYPRCPETTCLRCSPYTHLPKMADLGANDHSSVRMQALPRHEAAISACQEHKASRNL